MNESYKKLSDFIARVMSKHWLNSRSKDPHHTAIPNPAASSTSPAASPINSTKRRPKT